MSADDLYIPGETTVPYQCTPGPEQEVVATILRKTFAGLSVFGSSFIVWTIYSKWRFNRTSIDPYCRIMLGLSCYDVIWSFFPWFMGSWLMPAETGHWGASGNTQTCTMQGFFFWLGVPGAQYYQILLSLHTLLLVTFRWTPRDFEQKIERHSHKVVFVIALILATTPIFFEGYNPECSTCLPAPLPIWCGDWIFWGDGETECIRGEPRLSTAYYTIYLTNLSIMGAFCTGAMIQVYLSVRWQEDRNARYGASFEQQNASHRQKSRRIRRTMILYTFGFYLCWIVPSFIIHFAEQGKPMMVMSYILLPGQGFFNLIIFLAPKCAKYQKLHPGTWIVMAYVYVIFGKVCIPCIRCWEWVRRNGNIDALLRRSSHMIQSPFRVSGSQRQLTEQTLSMQLEEWEAAVDEDSIGFQDFNEEEEEPMIAAADEGENEGYPQPLENDKRVDGDPGKKHEPENNEEDLPGDEGENTRQKNSTSVRFHEETITKKESNGSTDDASETRKDLSESQREGDE